MFLTLSLAFAAPLQIDLDGDGKPETVRYDAETYKVHIGKHVVDCDGDPCDLEAHDVSSANKRKDVEVCGHGPRDDESCALYTIIDKKLVKYAYPGEYPPGELRTSGNGIVLAVDSWRQRLYERIEKYKVDGTKLVAVEQPIYTAAAPKELPVDKTFPLLYAPGDTKRVIANTRPNSKIHILGEHGEKEGWMLVRLSSGISGWVHVDKLAEVSEQYMMVLGAG